MKRVFEIILAVFSVIFLIFLISTVFLTIGVDSSNKATIIGGILSMIGGGIGAISAYLIAKMQLTKQLEMQDKKNRELLLSEIRIKRAEELLSVLYETKNAFSRLVGSWSACTMDITGFIEGEGRLDQKFNGEEIRNVGLWETCSKNRDLFIDTYSRLNHYRPFFNTLINEMSKEHKEYFAPLTRGMNEVFFICLGYHPDFQFNTYKEFSPVWSSIMDEKNEELKFIYGLINSQITNVYEEIEKILKVFVNPTD